MKVVKQALREKGLKENELPQEIQARIVNLKELIVKFNQVADEYDELEEEDKDTEKKLDDMEDYIAKTDIDVADAIRNYNPAPANPAPAATDTPAAEEPKKKDGVGYLVIGAILLVVTVGAVNIMKKR